MTFHGLVIGLTGAGKTTFMAEQIRGRPGARVGGGVPRPEGLPLAAPPLLRAGGGRGVDAPGARLPRPAARVPGRGGGQDRHRGGDGDRPAVQPDRPGAPHGAGQGAGRRRGSRGTFPGLQALLKADVEAQGKGAQQALVDLEARLRTVTSSTAEPWLRPGPDALHLERAVRDGKAVLLSVPVPRLRLVGEKLGAWALAEANRVASRLTATDWGKKTGQALPAAGGRVRRAEGAGGPRRPAPGDGARGRGVHLALHPDALRAQAPRRRGLLARSWAT